MFEKALEIGVTEANKFLGKMEEEDKNIEKSIFYYQKAIDYGDVDSQFYLACIYQDDEKFKDIKKAYQMFWKLHEDGNFFYFIYF